MLHSSFPPAQQTNQALTNSLATLGLKGGSIRLLYKSSQLMLRKNGCAMMSLCQKNKAKEKRNSVLRVHVHDLVRKRKVAIHQQKDLECKQQAKKPLVLTSHYGVGLVKLTSPTDPLPYTVSFLLSQTGIMKSPILLHHKLQSSIEFFVSGHKIIFNSKSFYS